MPASDAGVAIEVHVHVRHSFQSNLGVGKWAGCMQSWKTGVFVFLARKRSDSILIGSSSLPVEDWSKDDSEFTFLVRQELNGWAAVSIAEVTKDDSIALFPLDWETKVVLKLEPELPVVPSELRVVTKGHFDWTILKAESSNSWPAVKPREMVSDG